MDRAQLAFLGTKPFIWHGSFSCLWYFIAIALISNTKHIAVYHAQFTLFFEVIKYIIHHSQAAAIQILYITKHKRCIYCSNFISYRLWKACWNHCLCFTCRCVPSCISWHIRKCGRDHLYITYTVFWLEHSRPVVFHVYWSYDLPQCYTFADRHS